MSLTNFFSKLKGSSSSGNYGHSGRLGKRGGSSSSFLSSFIGKSLQNLSKNFEFILVGSAAVKMLADNARMPNDIDVLDITPKSKNSFNDYETDKDPRDPSSQFDMYDVKNNVSIQTFSSGMVVRKGLTEVKMPSAYSVSGEPNFKEVNGIKVLKEKPLLEQLYSKGAYDDMKSLIKGAKLPPDFIDTKWYRMIYEEM